MLNKMELCKSMQKINSNILSALDRTDSPQTCHELKIILKEISELLYRNCNLTNQKTKDSEQICQYMELLNKIYLPHFKQMIDSFVETEIESYFNYEGVEREIIDSSIEDLQFVEAELEQKNLLHTADSKGNNSFSDSDYEFDEEESVKDIMYDDFFHPPEFYNEEFLNEDEESIGIHENDELSSNGNDMPDENPEPYNLSQTSKTTFELEQEQIKKAIESYEDNLLKKPEWHLLGEVAGSNRPKNSLMYKETDFDSNAKPVPIEDNILNEKIEKAIKTIIKNKAFSDGQRKFKTNDITSYKKEVILEQTKNKKGLAAVYEEDYLKKKYGEQEEEDPKHVEIKKMMDTLFPELQALFCHIPKPAVPDIKIVSNLPAISVEEVAPTSVSDMALLAPEEVKKKSGIVKGNTEKTDTDRKRERRKKKILQRKKFKEMQTEESKKNPHTAKTKKLERINTLKKLKQHQNTKIADVRSDKIKSSKDFFSRLQDTVNAKDESFFINKKDLKKTDWIFVNKN